MYSLLNNLVLMLPFPQAYNALKWKIRAQGKSAPECPFECVCVCVGGGGGGGGGCNRYLGNAHIEVT